MHTITPGANVNEQIKSVSAIKKYPRARTKHNAAKARGRQIWRTIQNHGDDLVRLGLIGKESQTVISRMVLMQHLTPLEGQAARRYSFIIARFEKFCTLTRRNMKSQSYERAFGSDQELERHDRAGTTADYEEAARHCKKEYDKLMKVIGPYGSQAKSLLDDMCCSDMEIAADFRANLAVILRQVAKAFGVTEKPRTKRKVR